MNNIDKRALREAADSVIQKYGSEWFETGRQLCTVHKSKIELIAAANPPVVLALLDELEAKDKSINFLKERLAQLANFNPHWDVLEAATDSLREHMEELTTARARIAELEAREVKVKQFSEFQICHYGATEDYAKGYIDCQKNYNKALGAAGILVSINGEG